MSEKLIEVYEKYDMVVNKTARGRGFTLCYTDKGIRQVKPLVDSNLRLMDQYEIQKRLYELGFTNIDIPVPNVDGELITPDRYGTDFVVRKYFEGRECNLTNTEDVRQATLNLAHFHEAGRHIKNFNEYSKDKLVTSIEKHNKELKKVGSYVRKVTRKNDFEIAYMSCYEHFLAKAADVLSMAEKIDLNMLTNRQGLCHGSYNQHSILMCNGQIATVCFDKFQIDNQLTDLYHFIRKTMEKNQYNFSMLLLILDQYGSVARLTNEDYKYLYILFAYPEKFWKLSNYYLNSRKTFIPPKTLEKLDNVVESEKIRDSMLEDYKNYYSIID